MTVGTDLEIEATPSAFSFAVVSWDVTQSSPKSLRDIPKKKTATREATHSNSSAKSQREKKKHICRFDEDLSKQQEKFH